MIHKILVLQLIEHMVTGNMVIGHMIIGHMVIGHMITDELTKLNVMFARTSSGNICTV